MLMMSEYFKEFKRNCQKTKTNENEILLVFHQFFCFFFRKISNKVPSKGTRQPLGNIFVEFGRFLKP